MIRNLLEALSRLVSVFRRRTLDRDFDEEFAAHIDLLTEHSRDPDLGLHHPSPSAPTASAQHGGSGSIQTAGLVWTLKKSIHCIQMRRKSREKRLKLLKAALEVVCEEGLSGLSMRRLAARVGMTPMATYRHFRDKEALVAALVELGFERWSEYLDRTRRARSPLVRMKRVLEQYVDFSIEQPRLFDLMFLIMRPGVPLSPQALVEADAPGSQGNARRCKEMHGVGRL